VKKPRKRLTQTLAWKGIGEVKMYAWTSLLDKAYTYAPVPEVWATLVEQDGKWLMTVKLKGQKYSGERPTLEAAFKATANLLFKHAKEYWLRMDARVVTAPWSHTLTAVL
jgi:hypothetical protein